jgi:hypothetical protein
MKRLWIVPFFAAITALGALAPTGRAQSSAGAGLYPDNPASASSNTTYPQLTLAYTRPTEKIKMRNYFFDAFGPYAIAGDSISGAIGQADKTPPQWGEGAGAYGVRVGSAFGVGLITTTTRYTLAEAFREDTLYYRCECTGLLRRLNHAVFSTVTARRGADGHRQLSFPSLAAPYVGSLTAVYGWYPRGDGAEYGLRMGNYALLTLVGENIAREFIYGGPHTLWGQIDHPASQETDSAANSSH